jgi:preprotein translocase subunit SecG
MDSQGTCGLSRGSAADCSSSGKEACFVGFLSPYRQYFEIAQIIVSVALIVSILLQARGAGLGSVFGGTGTVFKTRRGIDRLLFRITIAFVVLFVVISLIGTTIPAPA